MHLKKIRLLLFGNTGLEKPEKWSLKIMNIVTGKWSFYINGALIALLIVLCLYLFDDSVGMGDGMVVVSEYCTSSVKDKTLNTPPPLDWQTGFLGGIFIGALAASIISGKWKLRIKQDSEGDGIMKTYFKTVVFGIAGGFLVMLGLQLAGDTFFGQWAAAIQMSTGAWVFLISSFGVAATIAILMERRKESGAKEGGK
ncbi:MAG: YeeE/YedE thiosulfate transporter family protein [Victivallaceae bacterium]